MKNRIKQWKKILVTAIGMICCTVAIQSQPMTVLADDYWPEGIEISSECAVVMEASTGTILYEKNPDVQSYPASITKIMTALLAIENSSLDEVVTFSKGAVYNTEGSSILRDVDEQLTMEQCLYALMLESANDCAYAIAEHVSGDIDTFVQMMNDRAAALGCTNTHFVNPHGLPDDNHYTSAHDMALIAQEAFKNETFRLITGTKQYTLPTTNKNDQELIMHNHHAMLYPFHTSKYLYDYCVGGKTGYTTVAGSTLVTYAQKDGMTLICVIMRAVSPGHYEDTTNLLNYYFNNFQMMNIAENEEQTATTKFDAGSFNTNDAFLEIDPDAVLILPTTAAFQDATAEVNMDQTSDQIAGQLNYSYAGKTVGTADIILTNAQVSEYPFDNNADASQELSSSATDDQVIKKDTSSINLKQILKVVIVIAVIVAAILLCIKLVLNGMKKKKYARKKIRDNYRKKRRKRRR